MVGSNSIRLFNDYVIIYSVYVVDIWEYMLHNRSYASIL